ncbi:hypothetical protein BH09BAC1_BH09BAC1_04900 [soil metagenome]
MSKPNPKKELAHLLYLETDQSQKEIAAAVETTEQTLVKWVDAGGWKQEKQATTLSPDKLIRRYYDQSSRVLDIADEESRALTSAETDVLVKLAAAIEKLDKKVNPSITMAVLMRFNNHLKLVAPELVKQIVRHQLEYVQTLIKPS